MKHQEIRMVIYMSKKKNNLKETKKSIIQNKEKIIKKTKIKSEEKKIKKKKEKKITINDVDCFELLNFKITNIAKEQILKITKSDKKDDKLFLRIMIDIGGCSGMRYHMIVDDYISENDLVKLDKETNNPLLVIDDYSFTYLKDSSLDFEETLENSSFKIDNPNSESSCSCGTSFSACGNY